MSTRALPLLAAVVLAGCGVRDPYAEQPQARAWARGEAPQASPPVATLARADGATSVLARYATSWVNWSATTLAEQRAGLLALSAGQLAQQLHEDAAQALRARLQEVSRAYSRGRYVGAISEHGGRALVVTFEEVAPLGGQAQGAYHVYLTRTARTAQGWRVMEWQPATDS